MKPTINDFSLGDVLGEGSYSVVYKATSSIAPHTFAIKVLAKRHIIKLKKEKQVTIEKDTLNSLQHSFITQLYFTFQDADHLFFVLEFCERGDLLGEIKKRGTLNEEMIRFVTAEMWLALSFMHEKKMLHRDVKPENGHIRLADFGTCKILENGVERANSFVGTTEYVSPELLEKRFTTFASDMWAMGCIVYHMAYGKPPFKGNNDYQTFQLITKHQITYSQNPQVSEQLMNLMNVLLEPQHEKRLYNLKEHSFFAGFEFENVQTMTSPLLAVPVENEMIIEEKSGGELKKSVNELEMKKKSLDSMSPLEKKESKNETKRSCKCCTIS